MWDSYFNTWTLRVNNLHVRSGEQNNFQYFTPGCNGTYLLNSSSYNNDIEGNAKSVRGEFEFHNFQSFLLGVRPLYNAGTIQPGLVQIEIKTECEIEYDLYNSQSNCFSDTPPNAWKNANWLRRGLTNDKAVVQYAPYMTIPHYGPGSMLARWRIGNYPLVPKDSEAEDLLLEREDDPTKPPPFTQFTSSSLPSALS